jgi:uncharacterized protein YkwD
MRFLVRRSRLRNRAAIASTAMLAAIGSVDASGAAARCSHDRRAASATVLHLLNAARAQHGAAPLRLDRRLTLSARRHSRDMVWHRYFAHESRSGARFSARIARTGWMRGRRRWRVGENLAWGLGADATPQSIVEAWIRSAPHRHNLLDHKFRVVGIGIASGTPGMPGGRTYTADFGS